MPIIALCPDCKGSGKVLREKPLMSNPKAPAAQAHRRGWQTCPRCKGTGQIGTDL
jgi:DnaJ-class molecular chaperone